MRHSNPVGVPLLWQRLVSCRRLACCFRFINWEGGRQLNLGTLNFVEGNKENQRAFGVDNTGGKHLQYDENR